MNVNSADIKVLEAQVAFDISGATPVIKLTNLSTGPNLAGVTYWVTAYSPSNTPIHEGSAATPDETGLWTNLVLTDPWPQPFNQIEWSGAPYTVNLYAKDSAGKIFFITKTASICRPAGNTQSSKNPYGCASTDVRVLCDQGRVFFQDKTSTSYKGLTGTQVASVLKVIYPLDATFTSPTPFQINNFSTAAVPITYSSNNYQFLSYSIYSYDFGNNTSVVIKYTQLKTFSVLCNIDLMPLICEYQKLIDSIENGSCPDVQAANKKLLLINPKFSLVIMGILQPLTGVDVVELIEEIKKIGGFDCNCCTAPTGIIPQTSSPIDGYNFQIVPVCGDISGTVTVVGNNIQLNLSDKSYVFNMGTVTGTTAFTVTPATNGCLKTYSLNVDPTQLATDILTIISTNADLVNLFNSIVTNGGGTLVVDGSCIFTSATSYNYTFTLAGIPSNTTFALVTGIKYGMVTRVLNFSLNLTNLPAFQTYLNGLGIGTFVVTNPSGQNVLITSTANPNILANLTYSIGASNSIASFTSTATGFTPLTANQVVQNIINYLCGITDDQVVTSIPYTISYLTAAGLQTITIPAGSTLSELIQALLAANQSTLANSGAGAVNCVNIKNQFVESEDPIESTDYLLGTKSGDCARLNLNDAFMFMIQNMSVTTKTAFCAAVISCGAGLPCTPYTYLAVLVTQYNTSCAPIMGIEYVIA